MIFSMKRQILFRALTFGIAASALILTGCSTTESRISEHPEIFQSLSPQEQALVTQGRIREGMSQNAVWLAWGAPEQKMAGSARGRPMETWVYMEYTYASDPYPFRPYGFGRFGGYHRFGGHRYAFYGDPFYDPFYSYITPRIAYPAKTVTFQNGRVVSWQYRTTPIPY